MALRNCILCVVSNARVILNDDLEKMRDEKVLLSVIIPISSGRNEVNNEMSTVEPHCLPVFKHGTTQIRIQAVHLTATFTDH